MSLAAGSRLGPYQILSPLAAGGMGEVFRAHDPRLGRDVAIKVLPDRLATDNDARSRFEREAKAVAALSHPNILSIFDVGNESGIVYAVMELLEGETLRSWLLKGPLTWRQTALWGFAVAEGLTAAHSRGITHRDLKPENIYVTTDGRLKILDFGLARFAEQPAGEVSSLATQNHTEPGTVLGTVSYMSPEQVRGELASFPSDIFSLGCVLYEMVTGNRAFSRPTPAETMVAILKEETPACGPEVPDALQTVIRRCLQKAPQQRFATAADLAQALKACSETSSSRSQSQPAASPEKPTSIAVLPFVDMSAEKDQEYFCDGMAEELINALTKLPGLRVASRTSAFQFKGKGESIQFIGEKLKTDTVLEGSVRKAGMRLRITVQLIKVLDGYHLWSEKYDREMQDIFAVQDEIAQAVLEKLKLELLGDQSKLIRRGTDNQEAYNLYLKGRYFWSKRYEGGIQKGMQFFQQAIEKDPTYALAYAGLADGFTVLGHYGFVKSKEAFAKARAAAEKALSLDPLLSDNHTSMAMLQMMDFGFQAGENSLLKAISLNPGQALPYAMYCMLLAMMGRMEEAIGLGHRALELDPLNPNVNAWVGAAYYYRRMYDQALEQAEKALEVDPNTVMGHSLRGFVWYERRLYEEAAQAFLQSAQASERESYALGALGMAYGKSGDRAKAQAILDELAERSKHKYVMPFAPALVYIGLGERDLAFEFLEKARQDGNSLLWVLPVAPYYDELRSDPRFAELLQRTGLARYAKQLPAQ